MARKALLIGVPAFFAGVVLFLAVLGPSRRTFLAPPRAIAVGSAAEFRAFCEASGLRGRRAVILARHLIQAEDPGGDSPEVQSLTTLMNHGVIRELFHVVPERSWAEVEWNLANVSIYRPARLGRVAAFEDGRVNVDRLARFWPLEEPALVLLHPAAWSPLELQAIGTLLRSGRLRTDLLAVLGGTSAELAWWTSVLEAVPP